MTARTYLGFDYGTRNIGVAVGRSFSGLAEPVATVAVHRDRPDWDHITRLIDEWRPDALVVGLPLNMDDSANWVTPLARRFGNRLRERYNLPVHMVDERLTSKAARDILTAAGATRRQFRERVDSLSAQTILQAYLDEHEHPGD